MQFSWNTFDKKEGGKIVLLNDGQERYTIVDGGRFRRDFPRVRRVQCHQHSCLLLLKSLRSLVRFKLRYGDAITTGLEMKSDLYFSHILERCEAFGVPRSPIRVHGRRLCKQLSTQKTKICPFLQTSFPTICKHYQTIIQPGALRNHQQEQQQGLPRKHNPGKCLFNVYQSSSVILIKEFMIQRTNFY